MRKFILNCNYKVPNDGNILSINFFLPMLKKQKLGFEKMINHLKTKQNNKNFVDNYVTFHILNITKGKPHNSLNAVFKKPQFYMHVSTTNEIFKLKTVSFYVFKTIIFVNFH